MHRDGAVGRWRQQIMEAPRSEETQPVGMLHLFSSDRGPEKDFPLYPGQNMIGRRPNCNVILPFPSISKAHAVIKIPAEGTVPFVRDCLSLNGTYFERPLRRLIPGMNHQLSDKDLIIFADLHFQFHYLGAPPLPVPEGAKEVEEIPSAPVIGEPQLPGTSLANDSKEEGVTKEPSPCPKKRGRGRPRKRAAREKEGDKRVEVETAAKTRKGGADLTLQPQEEFKGIPHQNVGQPSLNEEVTALPSVRKIRRKSKTFQPTAQEEAQKEQAGKAPDDNKAESLPEASD